MGYRLTLTTARRSVPEVLPMLLGALWNFCAPPYYSHYSLHAAILVEHVPKAPRPAFVTSVAVLRSNQSYADAGAHKTSAFEILMSMAAVPSLPKGRTFNKASTTFIRVRPPSFPRLGSLSHKVSYPGFYIRLLVTSVLRSIR